MEFNASMQLALEEARLSLREGNKGFGAVIAKEGRIISRAHDLETTAKDPTSHAEMNAIKEASGKLDGFAGCVLVSTHEPCPMCATAAVWAGISKIAYGYSIQEAIRQGRRRIDLTAREIFERAGVNIKIHENVLAFECSVLYRRDVRAEIEKLRNADDAILCALNAVKVDRRTKWFNENREKFELLNGDIVNSGYRLLL
jgi:tRNA(Arg) A34 adenosine deaminase TadA